MKELNLGNSDFKDIIQNRKKEEKIHEFSQQINKTIAEAKNQIETKN